MCRLAITILVLGAVAGSVFNQAAAQFVPMEDCAAATVLSNFSTITVPGGTYNSGNVSEAGSCMFSGETHSRWFVFTVTQAGVFNFTVTPSPAADFDWTFYDITSSATLCNIATATQLSCNYAGTTNPTGIGCADANTCNASLNVQPCHTYAILVNRYTSGSTSGFTLSFPGTTAQIGTAGSGSVSFTNTPVCVGQASTFTPSVTSGYNYMWDFGGGVTSTQQSPSQTFSAPGNYPVTLTINAINPTGCNDNATVTQNVFVSLPPSISVSPTSSNTCPGQSVALTATSGASNPTFAWSPVTALSATTGSSVTATPIGSTTYTVTVTNATGCTAQATAAVNVGTNFSISASASQTTICPNGTSDLSASGAASYSWQPAAGLDVTAGANVVATPTVTTSYIVTGQDNSGCSDTALVVVNVNTPPNVNVTPSNDTLCNGQSVGLTAGGAVTYAWSPATSLNNSTGATVSATPTSDVTYTVTGSDAIGCTAEQTATVVVISNPTVTVSPLSPDICVGDNVSLTATGAGGYVWTPATGLDVSNGTTVTASPTATTTYTVTGTVANACTASGSVIVNVNYPPTVIVDPPNASVCNGASETLTASGANSYAWSPATGLDNSTGATVHASPTQNTTYTVSGTSAAGCTAESTVEVVVNTPVQVIASANDSTVCPGTAVTLTGTGVDQYVWQPGNGNSDTFNPTPIATTTYTVTGTDLNGCTTQAAVAITVNAVAPVTASNTSGLICVGDSAVLVANGSTDYSWQPSIALSDSLGTTVHASPDANTTYTVTTSDANGCTNADTVAVNVDPLPVASLSYSPVSGCVPLDVSFANTSANSAETVWNFGDATQSNLDSATHSYEVGAYLPSLIITNAAGCSDTAYADDSIRVYPLPDALFSVSPDTGVKVPFMQGMFSFTNLSQNAVGYAWEFGDGETSQDENPQHRFAIPGRFNAVLVVTSEHGCGDSYGLGPLVVEGLPPVFVPNTFTPNGDGSNDAFNVFGVGVTNFRMEIFDRWGTQMFSTNDMAKGWDGTYKGKGANSGVYVYNINLDTMDGEHHFLWGDVTLLR